MTTIAYHHESGIIAYDSLITENGKVLSVQFDKKEHLHCEKNNEWFYIFGAGTTHEIDLLKTLSIGEQVPDWCRGEMFTLKDGGASVFHRYVDNGIVAEDGLSYDYAIGSGREYALAYMKIGKSAKESVSLACEVDIYSGGEVREFEL